MNTRTNAEWLTDLRADENIRDAALIDLRAAIVTSLPYALSNWLAASDPQFDALAEDVTQETILKVLKHLDSFQGLSQFTTWVQKIAVRVALTELRRRRWKDVSLNSMMTEEGEEQMPVAQSNTAPDPARAAEQSEMMQMLGRMIAEELTEKQRTGMIAVRVNGMPIDEVARQMGMERNALYKLLHDARLKLKKRMEREGLTPEEVLATFG
ncbi:MAG: RNA polymerase sigma factor [Chloroflexi bacterium]|nr:RNA polymerase sigma factor [Chloroflexota bacterium]